MQCARGQALRQLNYGRGAKAYEKDDIPAHVSSFSTASNSKSASERLFLRLCAAWLCVCVCVRARACAWLCVSFCA